MHNPTLIKTFNASGAISKLLLCTLAATAGVVEQATNASTNLIGIADPGGDVADGERIEVITHGFSEVVYGGNIANGDPITADANGKAVKAAPAAGVQVPIIGFAVGDGELDVIGSIRIAPGILTGV